MNGVTGSQSRSTPKWAILAIVVAIALAVLNLDGTTNGPKGHHRVGTRDPDPHPGRRRPRVDRVDRLELAQRGLPRHQSAHPAGRGRHQQARHGQLAGEDQRCGAGPALHRPDLRLWRPRHPHGERDQRRPVQDAGPRRCVQARDAQPEERARVRADAAGRDAAIARGDLDEHHAARRPRRRCRLRRASRR